MGALLARLSVVRPALVTYRTLTTQKDASPLRQYLPGSSPTHLTASRYSDPRLYSCPSSLRSSPIRPHPPIELVVQLTLVTS